MTKYIWLLLPGLMHFTQSCTKAQCQFDDKLLDAPAFAEKLKACPEAVVLDVRTPEEFEKGHLPNALNVDWNRGDFEQKIAAIDPSKPVFVYCLSGGRSAAATEKLRSKGFKPVIELKGGIMKWRAAGLPEIKGAAGNAGMSQVQFDALLQTKKLVLIDFYADWCAPCKKMAPYLEEIKNELADQVTVVRINADDNQAITKQLNIDALPVLLLYKNGQQVWRNPGFIEKAAVMEKLAAF